LLIDYNSPIYLSFYRDKETTPRHSGNFEQPQNLFPAIVPFLATRSTISLPHLGHARATSDWACMFPLCWTEAIICVSLGPSINAAISPEPPFTDLRCSDQLFFQPCSSNWNMHFLHIALLLKLPLLEHIPHMPRYNGLIALKELDHLSLVQPDGISLQMDIYGSHPVRSLVNNDLPLIFRWVHQHYLVKR
jgi:hypothetical protein